uniref:Peptidase S1 domain-containing protein n=1 Tax=Clastoptera arizonana TaxID=38151 RepID=A0A1B6D4S4_9HEMI
MLRDYFKSFFQIFLLQFVTKNHILSQSEYMGRFASIGEQQHVTYIQIDRETICSGAIINESWVLSAAHCFYKNNKKVHPKNVEVAAGINDYLVIRGPTKQESAVKEIIIHPGYWSSHRLSKYDIALLKLQEPFQFDVSVFFIELDGEGWPIKDGPELRSCTTSGFGAIKTGLKRNTKLKLLEVNATHGNTACPCTKSYQWKRLVCLPPSSQPALCQGDSGSVLVCNNKAVAVAHKPVSKKTCTIDPLTEINRCGADNIIAMYMYLCPMNDWIRSHVTNVPPTPKSCMACRQKYNIFSLTCILLYTLIKH